MIDQWIAFSRRILKLPAGDPKIPGDPENVKTWNPDEKYLHYSLFGFYIGAVIAIPIILILLIVSIVLFPAMAKDGNAGVALLVSFGMFFVGFIILASMAINYAIVHLELDMLRYTLTDQAVRLRRGVMKVEEVTLSYVNIQNVKFSQGPLQRYFGIADLIVETAGGGRVVNPQQGGQPLHHQGLIKGVSNPEALRDLILSRVQRVKGAGLGDDDDDEEPLDGKEAHSTVSIDSEEGRGLLREIRDSLVIVNSAFSKN